MKINLILAAAVASLILLSSCDEETPQARTVPVVVVEPVIEMEFADSVTEIGEVQAYDTVHLSANVSGFLTEANFKEGDLVWIVGEQKELSSEIIRQISLQQQAATA